MDGGLANSARLAFDTVVLEDHWAAFLAGAALVSGGELAAREATLDPGDPIAILFTSGTTASRRVRR